MMKALIGHTGFVGGNLAEQHVFEACYNSKNYREMAGNDYDEVWCAGISAVKWWANQNPEKDWNNIARLLSVLESVTARHFVLVSTVDVYKDNNGSNEDTPVTSSNHHPYGAHRVKVEEFIKRTYESYTIIRLPGLFGKGLKKNIIYDFLMNNELHKIHTENVFQFYDLSQVYRDICKVMELRLPVANFATEPVMVRDIAEYAFNTKFDNRPDYDPVVYDMHTRFADLMGGTGVYIQDRATVLERIRVFVQSSYP